MANLLVTLDEAKAHLEIVGTDADADITLKLNAAQAAIIGYQGASNFWKAICATYDATTVPYEVKACILLVLGELDKFRGDSSATESAAYDIAHDFTPQIRSLLRRLRDPVLQ